MASVKVAVRVRPMNLRDFMGSLNVLFKKKEEGLQSKCIIEMKQKKTIIKNPKTDDHDSHKDFTFDYSYWSSNPDDENFVNQQQVFQDLGEDVLYNVYQGYNACIFAYGQTGSGKSYTMMGTQDDVGLIPRIGQELFERMTDSQTTYRTEVSYLEIYNERVRDLLECHRKNSITNLSHSLKVREHPKEGPYVQDLSQHIVTSFCDIDELMERGNSTRTTASTNMNNTSSRSHAIFTISFTQAKFDDDSPSEKHSKMHLVDLAGSERADTSGATGIRLKEGGNINKSLVTLGNVISALADMNPKDRQNAKKHAFIPYRDSVLTWLLKDSLGGNSKTIMVAAISPASVNHSETLSTLRYANRAKNIVNTPTVNEDANVRLIRELRDEISRLRALLGGHIDDIVTPRVQEKLHENEARVKLLTNEWAQKWGDIASILKEDTGRLALRKSGLGVVLDSELPHLIGIDDNILSTGIMLYHLKDKVTTIGTKEASTPQDIVLSGVDLCHTHCIIRIETTSTQETKGAQHGSNVYLCPIGNSLCTVNGLTVHSATILTQGAVILLGKTNMFRFNNPAQVKQLKEEYKLTNNATNINRLSLLSQSMSDLYRSNENITTSNGQFYPNSLLTASEDSMTSSDDAPLTSSPMHTSHNGIRVRSSSMLIYECRLLKEALVTENEFVTNRSLTLTQDYDTLVEQIAQEVNVVSSKHSARLQNFTEDQKRLESTLQAQSLLLKDCEQRLNDVKVVMNKVASRELSELESQKVALTYLEQDACKFNTDEINLLSSFYSENKLKSHHLLSREITTLSDEIKNKRNVYLAHYKLKEGESNTKKDDDLNQVAKDKLQIMVSDEVFLTDCQERVSLAIENGLTGRAKDKELTGIETEKSKIENKKEELNKKIKDIIALHKKEINHLIEAKEEKVSDLQELMSKLSEQKKNWSRHIKLDQRFCDERLSTTRNRLTDAECHVTQCDTYLQETQMFCSEQSAFVTTELQWIEESTLTINKNHKKKLSLMETRVQLAEKSHNLELERNHHVNSLLFDMLQDFQSTDVLPERELEIKKQEFADYQKSKEDELRRVRENIHQSNIHQHKAFTASLCEIEEEKLETEHRLLVLHTLDEIAKQRDVRREQLVTGRKTSLSMVVGAREARNELARVDSLVDAALESQRMEHIEEMRQALERHGTEVKALRDRLQQMNHVLNRPAEITSSARDASPPKVAETRSNSVTVLTHMSLACQGESSLLKPIQVDITGYRLQGTGFDEHYVYEIKFIVMADEWTITRRYKLFRQLHNDLKDKYPDVSSMPFPPRRWFSNKSQELAMERRSSLEMYLRAVLHTLVWNTRCPLHPSHHVVYGRHALYAFNTFFRKNLCESTH